MLFVGTSIIHPSTEGVFLLCNILDLLIYSCDYMLAFFKKIVNSLFVILYIKILIFPFKFV